MVRCLHRLGLRYERVLVCVCGLGRLRAGLLQVVGDCKRRAEGRWYVQAIISEMTEQRRWQRVSYG